MFKRSVATVLVALTLMAWEVPDCPFSDDQSQLAPTFLDFDFEFVALEPIELVLPVRVERGVWWEQPAVQGRAHVADVLINAPKQSPPGA
jgi:hypothetical protein